METEELQAAQSMFTVTSRLLFVEPEEGEIVSLAEQDLFAAAPFGTDDPDIVKGFSLMREWLSANVAAPETRAEAMRELKADWLQLIPGVGAPKAPSWAGYYLSASHGALTEATLLVRKFYRRYGLELANRAAEPDDHLGIMLGFIAHLIGLELEGTDTVADQRWLLEDRILPWLPAWRYTMDKYAKTGYFRGLGHTIFGLCSAYVARFGIHYNADKQAFFIREAD